MKLPRYTVTTLIVLVATIAVDCAWVRYTILNRVSLCGLEAPAFDVGVLAMGSILLLGLHRIVTVRGRRQVFLIGFEVGGALAILGHMSLGRYYPDTVRFFLRPIYLIHGYFTDRNLTNFYIYCADAVIFLPPQLATAVSVGLLFHGIAKRRGMLSLQERPTAPGGQAAAH
jgi:hypothetical protein